MIKRILLIAATILPSTLRVWLWRCLGFRIGRQVKVAMFSLVVADEIEMGDGAVIETLTLVYRPRRFAMGERSRLASFVRVVSFGVAEFAEQSFVAMGCLIDTTGGFSLGARSALGPRGTYYSHGATSLLFNVGFPHKRSPIAIGSDTWVAMSCVVQPGVRIGDRAFVAPGMTVRDDVPAGSALLPNADEVRVVPSQLMSLGAGRQKAEVMERLLEEFALSQGSRLDASSSDVWNVSGKRGQVIWLRESLSANKQQHWWNDEQAVVWTLSHVPGLVQTQFCFDQLKVFGRRHSLAEDVADFLCRRGGVHFVFESCQKPATVTEQMSMTHCEEANSTC